MEFWGKAEPVKDINKYCKTVGLIFIGLGFLHIFLSGVLSSEWGILLIILGIISLFYRAKSIIIIAGVALILVGLLNLYSNVYEINTFWLVFSIFQIILGVQELRRYPNTKENPKYIIKKKQKKGFVWYGLRIGFYSMIIFWVFIAIYEQAAYSFIFSLIWICLTLFVFVVSIISLVRYKRKVFAIVSLLFSLVLLLIILYGFLWAISLGGLIDFTDDQIADMELYCDEFCFDNNIEDYEYFQVDYDAVKEKPICYCLDENQDVLFDESIPSRVYR